MNNITAIILSFNEERNIKRCLAPLVGWCPIILIDSFSTDNTVKIAREMDAKILFNEYTNHSSQWNWALTNANIETDWILALDSDFIITEKLMKELELFLSKDDGEYNGFFIKREYKFWNSNIRFGGMKKYWLRGLRKGFGKADTSDLVDFRFNVEGKIKYLNGKIIEDNEKDNDLAFWINKQDIFALRLAIEEELRLRNLLIWEGNKSIFGNTEEKIKSLRDIWLKLPLFIRPFILFIYRTAGLLTLLVDPLLELLADFEEGESLR